MVPYLHRRSIVPANEENSARRDGRERGGGAIILSAGGMARLQTRTHRILGCVAVVACGIGLTTCVEAPSEPTPAPFLEGNYLLQVGASTVCTLSQTDYQWAVQARTVPAGGGSTARATLPAGDDTIDLNLVYTINPESREANPVADYAQGTLTTRRVSIGSNLWVTITGEAQGSVTDAGGRGEIPEASFNGTISLSDKPEEEDPAGDSLGSCTAADHSWALLAG